ncbi:copper-transporting ATPase PAA1, chloroplastic-like [Cucurbita moschata]|uniref:Copper-transporting ATPase PAA1, chloroplastic-like n=1 Tax=Cucurbita moschata TaxID=3662 RepID=A0A6J1EQ92_CUCMO|nr:copper-transporting ATPase PAA1, chloroplastic-like [Cucurbita moschata]
MDSLLSLMASNAPLFTSPPITLSFSRPNFTHPTFISPFSVTSSFSLRTAAPPIHRPSKFIPISASGNGNDGVRGDGGGGDDDSKLLDGEEAEDNATLSADVIVLDVGGMMCTGCSTSVKRILESQPPVSHATVDLASETAFVWLVAEAKITPNWREELGEALAKHLTTCGFSSKAQGQGAIGGDVS